MKKLFLSLLLLALAVIFVSCGESASISFSSAPTDESGDQASGVERGVIMEEDATQRNPDYTGIKTSVAIVSYSQYDNLYYETYSDHIEISGAEENAVSIVIPDKIGDVAVTAIKDYAFSDNRTLRSVVLSDSLTTIGYAAFSNSLLESVTMGSGTTVICDYAFWNCTSLSELNLSSSLRTIGRGAFENCTSLSDVFLPHSVEFILEDAFVFCSQATLHGSDLASRAARRDMLQYE